MQVISRQFSSLLRQSLSRQRWRSPQYFVACRSLSTLTILEHREGRLTQGSLSAISAAKVLGGSVDGIIAGSLLDGPVKDAVAVEGLDKVITVDNEQYDKGLAENFAPMLVANIKHGKYTHVVAGHTAFGKGLMPRVAALMDLQQISDVISIQNESTFVRPIYAGNAIATVESTDPVKIITIRGPAFAPAAGSGGSAQVQAGVDPKSEPSVTWLSEDLTKSGRPDLASAERVVSGGRGLKSKENFDKLILPLADALGAAVGASRAAVDDGYADNSLQVGQTGKVVAPQLYMAVGISGAIQHLAGMKDSKVIVAINKNREEPIFQVADVGLVGDLFEVVPALTQKLKA